METPGNRLAARALLRGDVDVLDKMFDEQPALADFRGVFGESLLHLAYLYHEHATPNLVARLILRRAPNLVTSVYTYDAYQGENALHMVIANENIDEARFLVGLCPGLVHGRAIGTFFQRPEADFDSSTMAKAYYGETPLGFAVSTNQPAMVRLLVSSVVLISDADQYGNTAAHLAVFHKRTEIYLLLQTLWDQGLGCPAELKDQQMSSLRNNERYTPIVYAAAIHNDTKIFRVLWNSTRRKVWSWGAISCDMYPLDFIDSVGEIVPSPSEQQVIEMASEKRSLYDNAWRVLIGKQYDEVPTALSAAIDNQNTALFADDNIIFLIKKKWEAFGSSTFYKGMLFSFVFLLLLWYWVVILEKMGTSNSLLHFPFFSSDSRCTLTMTWPNFYRCSESPVEWLILLSSIWNLISSLRMMFRVGSNRFFDFYGTGWLRTVTQMVASFLIPLAFALEASGYNFNGNSDGTGSVSCTETVTSGATGMYSFNASESLIGASVNDRSDFEVARYSVSRFLIAIASMLTYIHFASFLLGFPSTGPFIILAVKIMKKDLINFLIILLAFALGFVQFFYIMQHGGGGQVSGSGFSNYVKVLRDFFNSSLESNIPEAHLWFIVPSFIILAGAMTLLNVYGAMLNETFSNGREDAERQYLFGLARMMLLMEKGMSRTERLRKKYWSISDRNRPALMVEKSNEALLGSDDRNALAASQRKVEEELIRKNLKTPQSGLMEAEKSSTVSPIPREDKVATAQPQAESLPMPYNGSSPTIAALSTTASAPPPSPSNTRSQQSNTSTLKGECNEKEKRRTRTPYSKGK